MKLLKHFCFIIILALICNVASAQVNDTITVTNSGPLYSGYTTSSCGGGCLYNTPVILPPGFTITEIDYVVNYYANSPCVVNQGGVVVSFDTCTQCGSCGFTFSGPCIFSGTSLFSSFKNCLPPAKCVNDTLNFVFDFYRTASPGGDCNSLSTTCVTFGSRAWSISVIGQIDTCTTAVTEHSAYRSVFNIFPNPSTSQIVLHSSSIHANQFITVTITNAIGEIIQEEKRKWTDEMSFNINSLTPGVYFVQLQNDKGRWVERFMKE